MEHDNTPGKSEGPQIETLSKSQFQENLGEVMVFWPLYRQYKFTGDFWKEKPNFSPPRYELQLPKALMIDCPQCVHLQPWNVIHPADGKIEPGFRQVIYKCRACGTGIDYWLNIAFSVKGGTIIKTGQYPPLELAPPPLVAAGMDKSDLALYRNALTCRHYNYGIAAVAYLRRIVENRTNFLIDLIAERLKEENPSSPLLETVEEVKKDRRFSEKIGFAAELLPASVRIGGHNPISLLHGLTSEALHGLSDEESVDVFDRCQLAFEHVIKRLKVDQEEDQGFRDALRRLNEKTPGKSKK